MMTLGIPGDPVTAILIGALLVHGLAPGPMLFIERADFAYGLIFTFFFANVFNVVIALLGVRLFVKLLRTPRALLMPLIAVLCVVGSYALRNSFFDVYVMLGFGLLGIAMRRLDVPVVPMLLALVLGRQLEEHLRVALTGSQGDVTVFFTSPFSLLFMGCRRSRSPSRCGRRGPPPVPRRYADVRTRHRAGSTFRTSRCPIAGGARRTVHHPFGSVRRVCRRRPACRR